MKYMLLDIFSTQICNQIENSKHETTALKTPKIGIFKCQNCICHILEAFLGVKAGRRMQMFLRPAF